LDLQKKKLFFFFFLGGAFLQSCVRWRAIRIAGAGTKWLYRSQREDLIKTLVSTGAIKIMRSRGDRCQSAGKKATQKSPKSTRGSRGWFFKKYFFGAPSCRAAYARGQSRGAFAQAHNGWGLNPKGKI
jgi:uncharacterized protein with PIN domain